jgi:alkylation response protein AidB-like acyl-CoA dehydrogenase
MAATTLEKPSILTDELIAQFGERAGTYDRENRFFDEDFEDLRKLGYLTMNVPREFGGGGLSFAEAMRETRRLAYRAPATALALNMHIYWIGIARDLWAAGDSSLAWILEEAAAGEIFAAGHGEVGNDLPVLASTASATRVEGGYRINGHKMFGSLTPVWTRLGSHGMDVSDPQNPKVVHVFIPRDSEGIEIKNTWDTLGMRATRSDDTILHDVFVPDRYVARILPPGALDPFIASLFAWGLGGFSNVYYAAACRARDLAVAGARKKTSLAVSRSMAYHPEIQHQAAEMTLALEAAEAQIEAFARDWTDGVDHGAWWPAKIVAAKYTAVETAKRVVDLAMDMSGGAGMYKGNELERLYRDIRAGGFHPANSALVHEIVGKTTLGIGLDEQPRWG